MHVKSLYRARFSTDHVPLSSFSLGLVERLIRLAWCFSSGLNCKEVAVEVTCVDIDLSVVLGSIATTFLKILDCQITTERTS